MKAQHPVVSSALTRPALRWRLRFNPSFCYLGGDADQNAKEMIKLIDVEYEQLAHETIGLVFAVKGI